MDLKRLDPMFADVARYTVSKQEGSTSRIQRAFEIGYKQGDCVKDLAYKYLDNVDVNVEKDYNDRDRFVFIVSKG